MGRAPCCDKANVKKGPWSPEEDAKLKEYIEKFGTGGNWIALPQKVGLKRCGKSCRLRWLNYLRPNIKHGEFSDEEDMAIINLFSNIGSRWSIIAAQLPGRTDNDIKNYWNTKLKKKLMSMMNQPSSHRNSRPSSSSTNNNMILSSSSSPSSSYGSHYSGAPGGPFPSTTTTTTFEPIMSGLISAVSLSGHTGSSGGTFLQPQVTPQEQMSLLSCGSSEGSYTNIGWGVSASEQANSFLEYGLEDIKQLISSNSNINNFSLLEESKTQERVLYYY